MSMGLNKIFCEQGETFTPLKYALQACSRDTQDERTPRHFQRSSGIETILRTGGDI